MTDLRKAVRDWTDALNGPPADTLETLETFPPMLAAIVDVCHGDAYKVGWWSNPETGEPLGIDPDKQVCLLHSELSEATEALRKSLDDDKLPHRAGFEVEIADFAIRLFNLIGYVTVINQDISLEDIAGNAWAIAKVGHDFTVEDPLRALSLLHRQTSSIWDALDDNDDPGAVIFTFAAALCGLSKLSKDVSIDLSGAMAEKVAFNRTRSDHKVENRLKKGGKAF